MMRMEYIIVGFVLLLIVLLVALNILGNVSDMLGFIKNMLGG